MLVLLLLWGGRAVEELRQLDGLKCGNFDGGLRARRYVPPC